MNITILSPADIVPLLCSQCGCTMHATDDDALFVCGACGLPHEHREGHLIGLSPLIAAVTTELVVCAARQYLAAWRLSVEIEESEAGGWQHIVRQASPRQPFLYVPAFSLTRAVIQRLGTRLTEAQPVLEQEKDVQACLAEMPPELVGRQDVGLLHQRETDQPERGAAYPFSPIVVSRADAAALAPFVYLGCRVGEVRDLRAVDYRVHIIEEQLVYIPAVYDARCIHDANWRVLLREFDDLVA